MLILKWVFVCLSISLFSPTLAIRSFSNLVKENGFFEAPAYQNAENGCPPISSLTHIAMTIDSEYLRGSMAAVHSLLKHTSCPENLYFHFIAAESKNPSPQDLAQILRSSFPSLPFKVYPFNQGLVKDLITPSIRQALENPLNYARTYIADILDSSVHRVIYLDSDVIVVDDIQKLWAVELTGSRAIGAPEYCHVDIGRYFTDEFWSDQELSQVLNGGNENNNKKKGCYFNTGVMVMDLERWREGNYRLRIEKWMEIQRERRIYSLGSLPPFLLVFAGEVEAIGHQWNQHGLGGDNLVNSCRSLHPGPISLLHWSGKGKPWVRLDRGEPCPIDHLWAPYDLYKQR
ncbi:probable galacturonosyltransferase-like 10 [Impatiens glandulifera]|uniref:probable galacturonosyltransferase-like 10 n=1 Tax=Impatiens glandulifera TaxID=253017 RepID=UPI001FB06FEF|nr:probable galacturonosyltransferase-like 10 [Impatiens glandulifera]